MKLPCLHDTASSAEVQGLGSLRVWSVCLSDRSRLLHTAPWGQTHDGRNGGAEGAPALSGWSMATRVCAEAAYEPVPLRCLAAETLPR